MKNYRKCLGKNLFPVFFALIFLPLTGCIRPSEPPPFDIEQAKAGFFSEFEAGIIYLPENWDPSLEKAWNVTVVLSGFSTYFRSFAAIPTWKTTADELGTVLFFVARDHMGWYEFPESEDSKRIDMILKYFRKQPWLKDSGLNLFGFSAGAIMGTAYLSRNMIQKDGKPLFDSLSAVSGGIGTQLEKDLQKDPDLERVCRIPVFLSWGDTEPPLVGRNVYSFLTNLSWEVEFTSHPGGHFITPEQIEDALRFSGI